MPVWYPIVVGTDHPTGRRGDPQQPEVVAGHELAVGGRLESPVDADVERRARIGGDSGQDGVVLGQRPVLLIPVARTDAKERLGALDRQHPPDDRIDEAENRGVGADAESERQRDRQREAGSGPQDAQPVRRVLPQFIEHADAPRVSTPVLHAIDRPELQPRPAPGLICWHPLGDQLRRRPVEVKTKLLAEVRFDAPTTEQRPHLKPEVTHQQLVLPY